MSRDPEMGTMNRQRLLRPQFGDQDREWHMMRSDRSAEARTAEPYKLWQGVWVLFHVQSGDCGGH